MQQLSPRMLILIPLLIPCIIVTCLLIPCIIVTCVGVSTMYSSCNVKTDGTVVSVSPTREYGFCQVAYTYVVENVTYRATGKIECSPFWPDQNTTRICYGRLRPASSALTLGNYTPFKSGIGMVIAGGVYFVLLLSALLAAVAFCGSARIKVDDTDASSILTRDSVRSMDIAFATLDRKV